MFSKLKEKHYFCCSIYKCYKRGEKLKCMQVFLGGGGSFCNEKCDSTENHSTENVHLLCCCGFKQRDVSICPQSDEHENEAFIWFIS